MWIPIMARGVPHRRPADLFMQNVDSHLVLLPRWLSLLLIVLITFASANHVHANPVTRDGKDLQRLSRAHFEFSLDMYTRLVETISHDSSDPAVAPNLIFSPYSLSAVLGMIFLGAGPGSETSFQLRRALHFNNLSFSEVHSSFKSVLSNLEDPYYGNTLAMANGLFQQKGVALSDTYKRALEEYYEAEIVEVDFKNEPSGSMDLMNAWVKQNTHGKISQLFTQPLDPSSKFVLTNALAIKTAWLNKFDPAMTFDKGLFYTSSKKRYEIPMMVGKFKIPLGYSHDLECRIAELPFSSKRISLFILLPDDVDKGLERLEANMTSDNVKALFSTLKDEVVNMRLPRFRVEQDVRLVDALNALGLHDIFNPELADLSGVSSEKLHVSTIVHRTLLEVQEEGVDGSAATAAGINRLGSFGEKYFEVDHPFVFFVWDYHSGILLFLGRVTEPEPIIH